MILPAGFGVIFDWDGVVIDSEDFHRRSWKLLQAEENLTMKKGAFEISFGMRNEQIIPNVFKWAEPSDTERIQALADRKESLYRELIRAESIDPLPGVVTLLDELAFAAVPTSVGSSTPRANIDAVMEVTGVTGKFREIVAAGDVTNGKPNPEVFLTAASRLGCTPGYSVVIEDAQVGIQAGKAGGFKVLAVATTHAAEELSTADICHPDLSSVTLNTLLDLVNP
ncbi:MAG: HAD-IA family hydrolase [Verrucomicrobiaceae bacterium]|nr:HAD-IA family hydrolase [Verrucomicrobiaceae bacterium]